MGSPVPGPPPTSPPVDEVLVSRLAELPDRPVSEHVAAYDAMHQLLQDTLATLDEA